MPYFQRKPIEGLADTLKSQFPIPGLPSRGYVPLGVVTPTLQPEHPLAAMTGIIEQATAVLAAERPGYGELPVTRPDTGSVAPAQSAQVSELQGRVNALIEQLAALVA